MPTAHNTAHTIAMLSPSLDVIRALPRRTCLARGEAAHQVAQIHAPRTCSGCRHHPNHRVLGPRTGRPSTRPRTSTHGGPPPAKPGIRAPATSDDPKRPGRRLPYAHEVGLEGSPEPSRENEDSSPHS